MPHPFFKKSRNYWRKKKLSKASSTLFQEPFVPPTFEVNEPTLRSDRLVLDAASIRQIHSCHSTSFCVYQVLGPYLFCRVPVRRFFFAQGSGPARRYIFLPGSGEKIYFFAGFRREVNLFFCRVPPASSKIGSGKMCLRTA